MEKLAYELERRASILRFHTELLEKIAKDNKKKKDKNSLIPPGVGATTGAGIGGTLGYLAAGEEGAMLGAGLGAITGYGGGVVLDKYRPEIKKGFSDARTKK